VRIQTPTPHLAISQPKYLFCVAPFATSAASCYLSQIKRRRAIGFCGCGPVGVWVVQIKRKKVKKVGYFRVGTCGKLGVVCNRVHLERYFWECSKAL
jgi:hypothetical protein